MTDKQHKKIFQSLSMLRNILDEVLRELAENMEPAAPRIRRNVKQETMNEFAKMYKGGGYKKPAEIKKPKNKAA